MLYIPQDDEIFPEWQLVLTVVFNKDHITKYFVSYNEYLENNDKEDWIHTDDVHINLEKVDMYIFNTLIKDGEDWTHYTPEKAKELIERENVSLRST